MLLSLPIVISPPFLVMFTGTVGFTSSMRIWICSSSLPGSRSSSSILSRLTNSPCNWGMIQNVPQFIFWPPAPRWQGHQQLIQARDQFGILRLPRCKAIHPGCPAHFVVGICQLWCTLDAHLVPELVFYQLWMFSMHLIHDEVGNLGIEIKNGAGSWKELTCKFLSINQFISKSSSSSPKGLIRASATLKYRCLTWLPMMSSYLQPSHVEEELKKCEHWNYQINLKSNFQIRHHCGIDPKSLRVVEPHGPQDSLQGQGIVDPSRKRQRRCRLPMSPPVVERGYQKKRVFFGVKRPGCRREVLRSSHSREGLRIRIWTCWSRWWWSGRRTGRWSDLYRCNSIQFNSNWNWWSSGRRTGCWCDLFNST